MTPQEQAQALIGMFVASGGKVTGLSGNNTSMLCPFHEDRNPSMSVNNDTSQFLCHGCGRSGNYHTYMKETGGKVNGSAPLPKVDWSAIPKNSAKRATLNLPDHEVTYPFFTADGAECFTVVRNRPERVGNWKVRPYHRDGNGLWVAGMPRLDGPRPLYRLPQLLENPDAPAVVVEGEKCVDALVASGALEKSEPTTWHGGFRNWDKSDWSPLKGRKVFLLADADTEGRWGMSCLARHLRDEVGVRLMRLHMPGGESGEDVADWAATARSPEGLRKRIGASLRDYGEWVHEFPPPVQTAEPKKKKKKKPEPEPEPEKPEAGAEDGDDWAGGVEEPQAAAPAPQAVAAPEPPPPPPQEAQDGESLPPGWLDEQDYFEVLGRQDQSVVIRTRRGKARNIFTIAFGSLTANRLIELAPHAYWTRGKDVRIPTHVQQAASSDIIERASEMDVVSEHKIRGLGATSDNGRVVFHLGDSLLLDGTERVGLDSQDDLSHTYSEETRLPWREPGGQWRKDAAQLGKALMSYRWEGDADGFTFIGWLGIALLAGAMEWRVNPWLIAPSGSGKSWLIDNVITRLFGPYAMVASDPTEASLSYWSGNASLPIVLDEMSAQKIRNQILGLLKLTSSGKRMRIRADLSKASKISAIEPRASFYLSSTEMPRLGEEFASRVSLIRLGPEVDQSAWGVVANEIRRALDDGKAERIRNGLVAEGPAIIAAATRHAHAVTGHEHSDREAHQVGAIAAGLEVFLPDLDISHARQALTAKQHSRETKQMADPMQVLAEILDCPVTSNVLVGTTDNGSPIFRMQDRPLLDWACDRDNSKVAADLGVKFLRFKSKNRGVYYELAVARSHPGVKRLARLLGRQDTDLYEVLCSIQGAYKKSKLRKTIGAFKTHYLTLSRRVLEELGLNLRPNGMPDIDPGEGHRRDETDIADLPHAGAWEKDGKGA